MSDPVFLDASFWIAYRDEQEARHAEARQGLTELFRARTRFVTTLPVLCEIHAYFARSRAKRELVLGDLWNNPLLAIEPVSPQDQEEAIALLRASRDKSYPLCDATSFVVMRRLAITRVAAFDNHFRQFGEFQVIP